MPLKKVVGLVSKSFSHKYPEFARNFSPYGYEVERVLVTQPHKNPYYCGDNAEVEIDDIYAYLSSGIKGERLVKGCMVEHSELVDTNGIKLHYGEFAPYPIVANHYSWLDFFDTNKNVRRYEATTSGIIDFQKMLRLPKHAKDVFGWDAIFCPDGCGGKSYYELLLEGMKMSARDKNIARVIGNYIRYTAPVDLHHHRQNMIHAIDFRHPFAKYIDSIPEYSSDKNPYLTKYRLDNILTNAINQGAFLRAPESIIQRLYWCPGLNSGMPLTPKKKDPRHELTYQFHDITHLNLPDLVFDGIHTELHRIVYISYRLMSEAITLVLADMFFVLSMKQNNMTYETVGQRKIFPIMEEILRSNPDALNDDNFEAFVHKVIRGSFQYCFFKDCSAWKSMMQNTECLDNFAQKYDAFFIEDFKWTVHNFEDMVQGQTGEPRASAHHDYAKWWETIKEWRQCGTDFELQSVSEFIDECNLSSRYGVHNIDPSKKRHLIEDIFDHIYAKYFKRLFLPNHHITRLPDESQLQNAFIRFMMGQSLIFFRKNMNGCTDITSQYITQIDQTIKLSSQYPITHMTIDHLRKFYENYLNILVQRNVITAEKQTEWAQIYPIFGTFSINYDVPTDTVLSEFVEVILGMQPQQSQ